MSKETLTSCYDEEGNYYIPYYDIEWINYDWWLFQWRINDQ